MNIENNIVETIKNYFLYYIFQFLTINEYKMKLILLER